MKSSPSPLSRKFVFEATPPPRPIQSLPAPPDMSFKLPCVMNTLSFPSPPRTSLNGEVKAKLKVSLPAPPSRKSCEPLLTVNRSSPSSPNAVTLKVTLMLNVSFAAVPLTKLNGRAMLKVAICVLPCCTDHHVAVGRSDRHRRLYRVGVSTRCPTAGGESPRTHTERPEAPQRLSQPCRRSS